MAIPGTKTFTSDMTLDLPNPNTGDPIRAADIRKLTRAVRRLNPCSSATVRVRETANGVTFDAAPGGGGGGGGAFDHPWLPKFVRSEGTTDYLTVTPGLINVHEDAFVPTINGFSMTANPRPELAVPGATLQNWVYLEVDFSYTIFDGFVTGANASLATIKIFGSITASTNSKLRIPLFVWQRGFAPIQWRMFNVDALVRDNGSATSTGRWFFFSR